MKLQILFIVHVFCSLLQIDFESISIQKVKIIDALQLKIQFLVKNPPPQINNLINILENKIDQINRIEDIIVKLALIYEKIVNSHSIQSLNNEIETENSEIIKELQSLVLEIKNQKIVKEEPDSKADSVIDGVLKDVKESADTLQVTDEFKEKQQKQGTVVETVIKVPENNTTQGVLIDSNNNQYVLSKSGDKTAHIEDFKLLKDILVILLSCVAAIFTASFLHLPSFFCYVSAGITIGHLGIISNPVQVETIARGFGVLFIMFYLGLEFNFEKIKRVWIIALGASFVLLAFHIAICVGVAVLFKGNAHEGIVIGASIFLSSTAVVLHLLKSHELDCFYGRNMVGILVAQDILLGLLLATMPMLSANGWDAVVLALKLIGTLFIFLGLVTLGSWPALYIMNNIQNNELFLLASIGFCLFVVGTGEQLSQSMELSCFVSGVLVGGQKQLATRVEHVLLPFRLVFGALFFASIGLHIFPSFLYREAVVVMFLTTIVVVFKIIITFGVMFLLFRLSARQSTIIAIGLGQISEFVFVLASKAKGAGILSRESFFLLLAVTTVSMVLSPLLWKGLSLLGLKNDSDLVTAVEMAGDVDVLHSFEDNDKII